MKFKLAGLLLLAALPLSVQAHKSWLLPSKSVVSVGQWVTVDGGTSTDPFVMDHNPLRLENLVITAPDGSTVAPENPITGKLRSSFDVQLQKPGTYKIAVLNRGLSARWEEDGQRKSFPPRGQPFTSEGLAAVLPAKAEKLTITQSLTQVATYATAGKPNDTALKPTGEGLELVPVTGFTDLYAGEEATFKLLLDGKPAANQKVEVVPGGVRYRNTVNEVELSTDKAGLLRVKWPGPGMYWLSASMQDDRASTPATVRRLGYTAVFEVLSP